MFGKATCQSHRHAEYDCLVQWSVSGRRFHRGLWCEVCKGKYQGDYPQEG